MLANGTHYNLHRALMFSLLRSMQRRKKATTTGCTPTRAQFRVRINRQVLELKLEETYNNNKQTKATQSKIKRWRASCSNKYGLFFFTARSSFDSVLLVALCATLFLSSSNLASNYSAAAAAVNAVFHAASNRLRVYFCYYFFFIIGFISISMGFLVWRTNCRAFWPESVLQPATNAGNSVSRVTYIDFEMKDESFFAHTADSKSLRLILASARVFARRRQQVQPLLFKFR